MRRHRSSFNSSSPYAPRSSPAIRRQDTDEVRHAQADWTETDGEEDVSEDDIDDQRAAAPDDTENEDAEDDDGGEDGDNERSLLPIFSAEHLGRSIHCSYAHG